MCGLVNGFIGEGSRARDDPYTAAFVDETWHNANFTLPLEKISSALYMYERGCKRTGAIMPGQFGPTSLVFD